MNLQNIYIFIKLLMLHNRKIKNNLMLNKNDTNFLCGNKDYFKLLSLDNYINKNNKCYYTILYNMYLYDIFFYNKNAIYLSKNFFPLINTNFSSIIKISNKNSIYMFFKYNYKSYSRKIVLSYKIDFTDFFIKKFVIFPFKSVILNRNNFFDLNFNITYVILNWTNNKTFLTSTNVYNLVNYTKFLNLNIFNMLWLFNNSNIKDKFNFSNYSLFLLKQYVNNFNNNSSIIKINDVSDSKVLVKKFVFFEFFLKKFLEKIIQKRILLSFVRSDLDFILNNSYYLMFVKRIKKLQIFNKDSYLVRELIEVLVIAMYTSDVICFKNWLIKAAEKMHFKLHKRFFYIIKIIISKYFNLYFKYFGCLGFCLRVQGKIGLGGSSKTRSFWIKSGQFSLTQKKLKLCYTSGHIRTYSGILGVEIILSYV